MSRELKIFIPVLVVITLILVLIVSWPKPENGSEAPFKVVNVYPHDPDAFTQGLVYDDGVLYEGTGLYGHSSIRKIDLKTGDILRILELSDKYFGEGITIYKDNIIQLTWKANVGFVYGKDNFTKFAEFSYPTEGWGLTFDGEHLVMSDGSAMLYFLNPDTFSEVRRIEVRDGSGPVENLNELEYVEGEIFANVWKTDKIVRIAPETGNVTGTLELGGLLEPEDHDEPVDVLNGIAYDDESGHLFVTGKLWPKMFELELNDD